MIATYHRDAYGFPANMRQPRSAFLLDYTGHAVEAAQNDRYGTIDLPRALDTRETARTRAELIEADVDTETGEIVKAVWRCPFDETRDVVLVVLMREKRVKTVWFNETNDLHKTLNKSRYARP